MSLSTELDDYQTFLVWRRPKDMEFKKVESGSRWVPDGKGGYTIGVVAPGSESDDMVICQIDGKDEVFEKEHVFEVNPLKNDGEDDCARLYHLNEPSVLHNLKVRYVSQIIYTYSGLFCVSINPYKYFPIYNDQMIQRYDGKRREEIAPHVFAVADEAYRLVTAPSGAVSQSILITGESGGPRLFEWSL